MLLFSSSFAFSHYFHTCFQPSLCARLWFCTCSVAVSLCEHCLGHDGRLMHTNCLCRPKYYFCYRVAVILLEEANNCRQEQRHQRAWRGGWILISPEICASRHDSSTSAPQPGTHSLPLIIHTLHFTLYQSHRTSQAVWTIRLYVLLILAWIYSPHHQ